MQYILIAHVCRYYNYVPIKSSRNDCQTHNFAVCGAPCHVPSLRVNHLATNTPSLSVPLSGRRCKSLTVAAFMFLASYVDQLTFPSVQTAVVDKELNG